MTSQNRLFSTISLALIAAAEVFKSAAAEQLDGSPALTINVNAKDILDARHDGAPLEVELDASGLPWDERIHAGTKSKTAAGMWTKRRGVDEGTYEAVVAELRKTYPLEESAPVPAPTAPTAPTVPTLTVPTAPAAPVAPPKPRTVYDELVDFIRLNVGADKFLTPEWLDSTWANTGWTLAKCAEDLSGAEYFLGQFRQLLSTNNIAEITC